ncbi:MULTISPECIES: chemotaxis protein CheA [Pseudobutyrivibrio]|jgi:two-component system chemotaxis sensor kinase CheA|uniref:Chemotaxis protein CheA n=1 Tax=Pseudobutyrivibrio ruminis DSM 9787 TaxID=1123011 RepID=A0A285SWV7_9FIRM|nr:MULTISPECIES: chemotaxis protein CheA [Pseudobutyrivibrio]MBE5914207.1 chemotaxis protein CheA [Pseudobutyrivibrio ruminis]SES73731.1 two-component system, chemotaxis family, sensor kinase CheA [Pseudobutyrivibrio sp. C4]SFO31280.1 two-component system, chemotaxis family, sensor kinase CheA [Pseudobutyrivibrio sp. JW11]SOC12727.1 two-component system, chemotaxis family, sensor kinase CheA [Pseudobutyrivibrio ruminis DSM 9787]
MDVSQYLDIFIDETSGHIQSLSDNIMELEKEPDNKDVVNEIFRAAHSLKGMAGTMGFKRMQHLTHDMENVFQEVRNDNVKVNSSLIDILFKCLDAIEAYLDTVKATSNEGTEENEALIKLLNDYLTQAEGGEAPADAAPAESAEPAAEASSDAADGPLFKQIKLDPEAIEKLKGEKQLYGFTIHINKECLLKAARAFLVFKAVEDFGTIMAFDPSSSDIEDEKFEFDFSFILSTEAELDPILEAVKAVSEIESVEAEKVTPEMYEKKEEEAAPAEAAPAEAAAPAAPAAPAPAPAAKPAAPAAKAGGKNQPANKPVTSRTIRVDIEKLDALMNQVSELIIAKNSLASQSNASGEIDGQTLHENIEYLERITTNLHESVMKVRMVPIESVVAKFPRMIRDLDRKLNKPMELVMTGEDTELDRTVVDQLGDPLQHLLRNSADHGIESPEDRRAAGKPEKGTIFLNAFQEGNNVIIEVGDDGGGINTDKVRDKAVERGLVTPEEAENLSQKEIIDFLFMPSFSMAKQITDISGRGVGLDVVKSNIEALGGDVTVKSVMGEGSTFTVRLPLTLAIIQALMVEIRDEKYAIALASIMNIENIPKSEIKYVESKEVIHLRGQVIPLIHLDNILDLEPKESDEDTMTVVICKKGDTLGGIIVDNLIGQLEIVIKSLGKLDNNKLISGATILGDGEIAMILDVNAVI